MHKLSTECRAGDGLTGSGPRGDQFESVALLVVLSILGVVVATQKIALIKDLTYSGHADESGYVQMARSLAAGQGLAVRYISAYLIPYDRGITHSEDHWPPLLSTVIAIFIRLFGDTPRVYRLAPIWIGSVAYPLAGAWLTRRLTRRLVPALGVGFILLTHSDVFTASLTTLSDILLGVVTASACAALLTCRSRPQWHLLAGFLTALAYYAKGSYLLFALLYPGIAALVCGFRSLKTAWPWIGAATALMTIAPWLVHTNRHYGNPLHSTQNYYPGVIGLVEWEHLASIYWDRPPHLWDRFTRFDGRWRSVALSNVQQLFRDAIEGPPRTSRQTLPLPDRLGALLAVSALVALLLDSARRLWATRLSKQLDAAPDDHGRMLVWSFILVPWAFLSLLWLVQDRFILSFLPMLYALGADALTRAVSAVIRRRRLALPRVPFLEVGVALGALLVALVGEGRFRRYQLSVNRIDDYPYGDQPTYPQLGQWLAVHDPTAVVMTRNPWELEVAASPTNKAVTIPYASAEWIFGMARYYRVTYLFHDAWFPRPMLEDFVTQRRAGLVPVRDEPSGRLYRLDYSVLPGDAELQSLLLSARRYRETSGAPRSGEESNLFFAPPQESNEWTSALTRFAARGSE